MPDAIDIAIRIILVIATSFIFSIMFAAYLRLRNRKLLFVSIGFGIFFAHALVTIPELFMNFMITENMHLLIHAVALSFILVGILKD